MRVRVGLDVVGAEIDVSRVVGDELRANVCTLGLCWMSTQRAALGRLHVEAGVLLALAIARDDEELAVGGDGGERRSRPRRRSSAPGSAAARRCATAGAMPVTAHVK